MRQTSLVRNSDFVRAYKRGKNVVHPHVVVYVNKNRVKHTRVGITCSKKVGKAVVRNRARRVLRSGLEQVLPNGAGGVDIVLVARGRTPFLKSWQLAQTLRKLLPQAGIQLGRQPGGATPDAGGPAPAEGGHKG